MGAWSYDSYANDNVFDFFHEKPTDEEVIEYFTETLDDNPGQFDLEFAVGIMIYQIRLKKTIPKKTLVLLKDLIKFLIQKGNFKEWIEPEKRIEKLKHELKIIQNLILNREVKFGEMKKKPEKYLDLNSSL